MRKILTRLLLIILLSVLNFLLWRVIDRLQFPLFMDSIGTAVAAAILGPVPGLIVALITQLSFEAWVGFNWMFAPWVVCSFATALIVGVASRRGKFSTLLELSLVMLAVTFANALLGALLHFYLYGGYADHATDMLVQSFEMITGGPLFAAFWARVPVNLLDKGIAVSVAFAAARRWGTSTSIEKVREQARNPLSDQAKRGSL